MILLHRTETIKNHYSYDKQGRTFTISSPDYPSPYLLDKSVYEYRINSNHHQLLYIVLHFVHYDLDKASLIMVGSLMLLFNIIIVLLVGSLMSLFNIIIVAVK